MMVRSALRVTPVGVFVTCVTRSGVRWTVQVHPRVTILGCGGRVVRGVRIRMAAHT